MGWRSARRLASAGARAAAAAAAAALAAKQRRLWRRLQRRWLWGPSLMLPLAATVHTRTRCAATHARRAYAAGGRRSGEDDDGLGLLGFKSPRRGPRWLSSENQIAACRVIFQPVTGMGPTPSDRIALTTRSISGKGTTLQLHILSTTRVCLTAHRPYPVSLGAWICLDLDQSAYTASSCPCPWPAAGA